MFPTDFPSGTVYRLNKIGPRTLPCGTLKVRVTGSDVARRSVPRSPIATCWVLPVRKEAIHFRVVSLIPKVVSSLFRRIVLPKCQGVSGM